MFVKPNHEYGDTEEVSMICGERSAPLTTIDVDSYFPTTWMRHGPRRLDISKDEIRRFFVLASDLEIILGVCLRYITPQSQDQPRLSGTVAPPPLSRWTCSSRYVDSSMSCCD